MCYKNYFVKTDNTMDTSEKKIWLRLSWEDGDKRRRQARATEARERQDEHILIANYGTEAKM